jgi:6-phosphogluconolactonase (cycloisomerase 2 family)
MFDPITRGRPDRTARTIPQVFPGRIRSSASRSRARLLLGLLSTALSVIPVACSGGGSTPKAAAPTVSVTASPSSVTLGSSTTLTWSSTNATSCTASGAWSGTQNTSGPAAAPPAAAGTSTYTLTCTGIGGSANASASVTVNAPAAATVTISVSPTTINEGSSATLTWSSTNATSCIASGAWSGTQSTSGSESVSPTPVGSYTYTLACNGAGGNASGSATLSVNATPVAFVYTTDGDNTVAGFGEAQGTGQLSPLANSPFSPGPTNLIALLPDPTMNLLFVVSAETTTTSQGTITSFAVDPSTGNLMLTGNSTTLPDAPTGNDLILGPGGNVLYVTSASSATIMAYSIASGGALTPLPGSPFNVPCIGAFCGNDNTPGEMIYDAADKTLYVINTDDWTVATFSVATSGSLTYIANTITGADVPESLTISPNGSFLYAPNQLSNNISAFTITPNATLSGNPEPLTPITGQPFANANGSSPDSPAIEPTGQYLYVNNNGAQTISAFSINQSSGALTQLSGSPFSIAGTGENNQLVIDPTGSYLYVANQAGKGNITGFAIDTSSGALTPLPNSPFTMGTGVTQGPTQIVIYNP